MTEVSRPSWLGQALTWAARLSRIGVWVGGALTLASVLLISYDVTVRRLPESYHVATMDNDAPTIFEESAAFVARVTA